LERYDSPTSIDATNRFHLKNAIELMKDKPPGSWALVCAYVKIPNYEQLQRAHAAAQRMLEKNSRTPLIPPMELIAEKCGYVVVEYSNVVIFHINDLSATPSSPILHSTDQEAITANRD
jgi:hypothetical protein